MDREGKVMPDNVAAGAAGSAPYEPRLGSHIPALDAIRGLAILMVTLFRFSDANNIGAEHIGGDLSSVGRLTVRLFAQGDRGVDLFFVLSGFLITGILFDAKGTEHYFRNFYVRRTLRIFPLYYGVLFFYFVLTPLLPFHVSSSADLRDKQLWLWLYAANIYQAIQGQWALGDFNHFWSLAVEEHYYLIWPMIIFFTTRRSALGICLAIMVLSLACRIAVLHTAANEVAAEVLTPCRMDALSFGSLLALLIRGPQGVRPLVPWAAWGMGLALVGLLAFFWYNHRMGKIDHTMLTMRYCLYNLLFGCMIILAITTNPASLMGCFWNLGLLRFFGKFSYGWYVFQNLMIPLFLAWFSPAFLERHLGSAFAGRMAYILLASVLSFAVAIVSWHVYEKHFLKLKVYFEPRKESCSSQAR